MRTVSKLIFGAILVLFTISIYRYGVIGVDLQAEFLLTIVSAAGALGGIAFAIYGWYSSNEIPKRVKENVDKEIKKIKEEIDEEIYRQQEAMQKMNAVYNITNTEQKIEILNEVISLYPKTYNAYVTLAYTYWYEKDDLNKAEDNFLKELEQHPKNYQAMCDLVALYASEREWRSALKWIEKAIEVNPNTKEYFKNDSRLSELSNVKKSEFDHIIQS